jgi:PhnB protein
MTDAIVPSKQYHTVTPHLTVRGAEQAIAFYKQAFGAEERYRMPDPNGEGLWHAEIRIGDSYIFLNDEYPDMGSMSPNTLGGSSVTLHLEVENVDAWVERAVRAGAAMVMPVEDMFWGDRYGKVVDPFGHHWSISSPIPKRSGNEVEETACA